MLHWGLAFVAVVIPVQLFFGHLTGLYVLKHQPAKFAAIEARVYSYTAACIDQHRLIERDEGLMTVTAATAAVFYMHNAPSEERARLSASVFWVLPSLEPVAGVRTAVWGDALQALLVPQKAGWTRAIFV